MQIKEARIFNFGKLQNVNIPFKEGINVVYGANEQGKTTLHAFLVGMLFGMEKGRGRAGATDAYSRYEPWHAPSFYSGALRFRVGEQPFYLERNFYAKEKSDYLRNESDGEELSVAYGDLKMLLGGIGREEFGNTYDIPQSGAANGKEMAALLTAYLAEATAGGDGKVRVLEAIKRLGLKKKEVSATYGQLLQQRQKKKQECELTCGIHKNNVEELKKQIQGFEAEQEKLEHAKKQREEKRRQKRKYCALTALATGALMAVDLFAGAVKLVESFVLESIILLGLLFLCSLIGILAYRKEGRDEALYHAAQMLSQMRERLKELENELINMEEFAEGLARPTAKEVELEEDMQALELAKEELKRLAEEYYLEVCDTLNAEISKWISLLTDGQYDSARLDKEGRLLVLAEQREVAPEALSRGTLEQIYLALRLAAGTLLMTEEEMPIFLDEAFAMYDDIRLAKTLQALAATKKQVIIFTCQSRELVTLDVLGVPYHKIVL